MDLFTRLERAIEHLFEGLFTHTFRGRVQPVEVARRLTRAMEDHKMVSVNQTFAPNVFEVALNPEDYQTIQPFEAAVIPELLRHVDESAKEAGYGLLGKPAVSFREEPSVERGDMKVEARFVRREEQSRQPPNSPTSDLRVSDLPGRPVSTVHAALQVVEGPDAGDEFPLHRSVVTIGRGGGNDIALTDSSVSRTHAEIHSQPEGFLFKDLGSKNGSLVNGTPVGDVLLQDGDSVTVGATVFRFRAARVV